MDPSPADMELTPTTRPKTTPPDDGDTSTVQHHPLASSSTKPPPNQLPTLSPSNLLQIGAPAIIPHLSSLPSLPPPSQSSTPPEPLEPFEEFLFLATICAAQLTTQAGACQALPLLPTLRKHYDLSGSNSASSAWFIAAYSLTVGTFILVSGRLGDVFGHKKMLVRGYIWFGVWSLVCGFAGFTEGKQGVVFFDVARALQGVGAAVVLPNGLALLGSRYHCERGRKKDMVFAVFGAMAPVGGVVGALAAGIFERKVWWPWGFWGLGISLLFLAWFAEAVVPGREEDGGIDGFGDQAEMYERGVGRWGLIWERLKMVDLVGAGLGVTALVLINVAWNQGAIVGWTTSYTYILLIIGVLILPVFFYIELYVSAYPLLPLKALKDPAIAFVLSCVACGWGCFGIWLLYIWEFHMELRGASPLLTTAYMSPVAVTGAIAALATGYLLGKIGPAWTMVAAMSAFVAGIALVATMPVDQTYWGQAFVCVLVITWGMDMSFPASTVILSNAVGKADQGVAASLVSTVVNYSISLALGFAGTAEANVNKGGTTQEDLLRGYRAALYVGVGLAGLGWVLSLVFLWVDYRRRKAEEGGEETVLSS